MSRQLGSNNVLRAIGGTIHLHKARPPHYISVQLNSGLTNFSDSTDQANLLASKENGEALMNAAENYNTNE